MRENISPQLQLGEVDIADVQFNPRSRDDIHQLLMGLQHLYINKYNRHAFSKTFKLLKSPSLKPD